MIAEKLFVFRLILIGSNTKDHAVAGGEVLLERNETGDLCYAGSAPASPKIQNDDFAAKIGQVRRFSIKLQSEVLRGLPGDRGFALAIVGEREKGQDGKRKTHAAPSEEFTEQWSHIKL